MTVLGGGGATLLEGQDGQLAPKVARRLWVSWTGKTVRAGAGVGVGVDVDVEVIEVEPIGHRRAQRWRLDRRRLPRPLQVVAELAVAVANLGPLRLVLDQTGAGLSVTNIAPGHLALGDEPGGSHVIADVQVALSRCRADEEQEDGLWSYAGDPLTTRRAACTAVGTRERTLTTSPVRGATITWLSPA